MQFLSLAPTSHVEAKLATAKPEQQPQSPELVPEQQPSEVPIIEKTSRSDSTTTDESSSLGSPRGSVVDDALAAEIRRQLQNKFLSN